MKKLISTTDKTPIEIALGIDEKGMTTARNLYEFLCLNRSNYSKWCKTNILDNEFAEESIDYIPFVPYDEREKFNPNPTTDYKLSSAFAKKLSMTAKNEKGEQARNYFLLVEDKLKEVTQPKLPATYKEALQQLLVQVEENEKLALENEEMKPKADYFDAIVDRKLLTNFRDTAKELSVKEKDFISFLIAKKYIYRDQTGKLKPYAERNTGLFELKEYAARYSDHAGTQTLITPKGRETFRLILKGETV